MSHSALTRGRSSTANGYLNEAATHPVKAIGRRVEAAGVIIGAIAAIAVLSIGASYVRLGPALRTTHAVAAVSADSALALPAATLTPPVRRPAVG